MNDDKFALLYSAWTALDDSKIENGDFFRELGLSRSNIPKPPHLENCNLKVKINERLDKRGVNGSFPPWTGWKGFLGIYPEADNSEQMRYFSHEAITEGAYPPWVSFLMNTLIMTNHAFS